MLVKMNCANGESKALTLEDLSTTGKTAIYTLSGNNASWEATEDCVMGGGISVGGSNSLYLYMTIDGVETNFISLSGSNGVYFTLYNYGIFIPKGTIIKTGPKGTFSLAFYPIGPA